MSDTPPARKLFIRMLLDAVQQSAKAALATIVVSTPKFSVDVQRVCLQGFVVAVTSNYFILDDGTASIPIFQCDEAKETICGPVAEEGAPASFLSPLQAMTTFPLRQQEDGAAEECDLTGEPYFGGYFVVLGSVLTLCCAAASGGFLSVRVVANHIKHARPEWFAGGICQAEAMWNLAVVDAYRAQ